MRLLSDGRETSTEYTSNTYSSTTYNSTWITVNSMSNSTADQVIYPPRPILYVIVWMTIGVLGNCLAIVILTHNERKHKWRIFYRLVLLLAISDLLGQITCIPISLVAYSNIDLLETEHSLCEFMSFMAIVTTMFSISLVCLMSADRFIAAWRPFFYKNAIKTHHVYLTVTGTLFFAVVVGILPILGINRNLRQKQGTWCFVDFYPTDADDRFYLYLCAVVGISAVAVMLLMNGMVLCRLCQMYTKQEQRKSTIPTSGSGVKKIQNIVFLSTIMVLFICSWLPVTVSTFYVCIILITDYQSCLPHMCRRHRLFRVIGFSMGSYQDGNLRYVSVRGSFIDGL